MEYHIRKAQIEDLESTADLFNLYRVFYRQESNKEASRAFIQERLTQGDSEIFLVFIGEKAVGFVQLYSLYHYITLQKQWLLSDLFVAPNHRGLGLSIALIDRSKQWCEETNACGLLLETEKTNIVGNKLYPKCGFIHDTAHNFYHWWR